MMGDWICVALTPAPGQEDRIRDAVSVEASGPIGPVSDLHLTVVYARVGYAAGLGAQLASSIAGLLPVVAHFSGVQLMPGGDRDLAVRPVALTCLDSDVLDVIGSARSLATNQRLKPVVHEPTLPHLSVLKAAGVKLVHARPISVQFDGAVELHALKDGRTG